MELELWQLELKYAALRIGEAHRQARVVAALASTGSNSRCWSSPAAAPRYC
jgi:hypothetical protein